MTSKKTVVSESDLASSNAVDCDTPDVDLEGSDLYCFASAAEKATISVLAEVTCREALRASLHSRAVGEAQDGKAFAYGETNNPAVLTAIHLCACNGLLNSIPGENSFVDLGSGRGNVVLLAASSGKGLLSRFCAHY
eukprot:SAG31_NODE_735_length_12488_cov_7.086044_15_plen_137_part_00